MFNNFASLNCFVKLLIMNYLMAVESFNYNTTWL